MINSIKISRIAGLKASELRLTYLVGAFLTLIALIVMTQNYFKYSYLGEYSFGMSLAYNLIVYTTYAALTPLIFGMSKRFPLNEKSWISRVPFHLSLSILLGLVHMLFCNVVLYSVDLASSIIFPRFMSKYLTNVIHFHLLAYWAILLLSTFRKKTTTKSGQIIEQLSRFSIGKNGRTYFVEFDEVYWIEAMDHYQKVHTADGYHIINESMKSLEAKLPSDIFVRIHRSYFINIDLIESLMKGQKSSVQMKNGKQLKVGISYQKSISNYLN